MPFVIRCKEKLAEDSGPAHFIDLGEVTLERIGDNLVFGCQLPRTYQVFIDVYYMAESASGQDEANPVFLIGYPTGQDDWILPSFLSAFL